MPLSLDEEGRRELAELLTTLVERAAQLQAERLLEAREQSHRQQVLRLENQVGFIALARTRHGCTGVIPALGCTCDRGAYG